MTSPVDYTTIVLIKLTDLQGRVTKQDAIIAALLATVERLSGQTITVSDTMRTSVPLRSHQSSDRPPRGRPQVAGAGAIVVVTGAGVGNGLESDPDNASRCPTLPLVPPTASDDTSPPWPCPCPCP